MPGDTYPILQYRDARAAIDWLERAFGFQRTSVHDGPDAARATAATYRPGPAPPQPPDGGMR